MSHVKRDGKCYDLDYEVIHNQGFEVIGYSFISSSTLILALLGLIVNWRVSVGIVVIGCLILAYSMYSDRARSTVDLSRGKEVPCPPDNYDYNQQARDVGACIERCTPNDNSCITNCNKLVKYNVYRNV